MNRQKRTLFPTYSGDDSINLQSIDDAFFEEAFAKHPHSATEPNRSFIGLTISKKRFFIATVVVLSVIFLFIVRTGVIQVWQGDAYRNLAEENRMYHKIIPSERGVIKDRNGVVLAENIPSFQLITSNALLPKLKSDREQLLFNIAKMTKQNPFSLIETVAAQSDIDEQILLSKDIPYDTAMYFASQTAQYPALELEISSKRQYITDNVSTLSHVLGYIGAISEEEYEVQKNFGYRTFDLIGKQGIEAQYESFLRGTFGETRIEVDAHGSAERIISKIEPINGKNITLTIDVTLQEYIEEVLETHLKDTTVSKASVVAMNPANGEILGLVSWPAFDANDFVNGIDADKYKRLLEDVDKPLYPRAVVGEYPSGSTIKPIYAAAALTEKIITSSTSFLSTGGINVGIWFFPDWRAGGHGLTNIYWAIADSVNTFFYIIGGGYDNFDGLGIKKLMEYAHLFGFGQKTGIDLPSESVGFLPSPEWKWETKGEQWYIGDTYHVAIGQGDFLVTPLQIARATAVFANNGFLIQPHLNIDLPTQSQQIINQDTVNIIKDAMRYTITGGSAQSLQTVPVSVAGKTGTAQWSKNGITHSWFTGFAPFDNPDIMLTILIEEGGDDYLAVPIAKDILSWRFSS